jgi:hypothetical protein
VLVGDHGDDFLGTLALFFVTGSTHYLTGAHTEAARVNRGDQQARVGVCWEQ